MEKQQSFTDMEYTNRRRKTRREEFLEEMDATLPWKEWVAKVEPYYPEGKRGRRPQEIERMLRMTMLQTWYNLSDEGIEDAIYDSYAMKTFMRINFNDGQQAPDATTLCKFRKLLNEHKLQQAFFAQVQELLASEKKLVTGGTIVDATIIDAPNSTKNKEHKRDPEMRNTKKNNTYHFGMRTHIGADPYYGFVHTVISTPANEAEVKVAPELLRDDDETVYGDSGFLKMENYVTDGIKRNYHIARQRGTFKRHYGDGLSWQYEKQLERLKASVRSKIEYVFHIVKDIFHWRKLRYKGIAKNDAYANLLFASANLYILASMFKIPKLSTSRG